MKIAVSSNGQDLDATINDRFGRSPYFLIVDTKNLRCEAVANIHADLSSAAGIQAASLVVSKKADVVITGNCGPKAMRVFTEAGVRVVLDQHGPIRAAVEQVKSGSLTPSTSANAPEKAGATPAGAGFGFGQPGMGGGRGLGGGRGMGGCGRGMGMGGGCGSGRRFNPNDAAGPAGRQQLDLPGNQELLLLQQQAEQTRRQLEAIQNRIKELT
jgi:predicted Fe-Mo cluster-binding NifX family protein